MNLPDPEPNRRNLNPRCPNSAEPDVAEHDLDALARHVRSHAGLTGKQAISLVGEVLGSPTSGSDVGDNDGRKLDDDSGELVAALRGTDVSVVEGFGDDGAVARGLLGEAIVCGEAIHPDLVAADPFAAGVAAVVANVNDIAAMAAVPVGIVNTIVAPEQVAAEVLRGLKFAAGLYGVKLMGGHLTHHHKIAAVSAFGLGRTATPGHHGSIAEVEAGQVLVFACCLDGAMREGLDVFSSIAAQGARLRDHIRLPAVALGPAAAVAARDVSMAGIVGSLAMLLEYRRLGATVDLGAMPKPSGVTWRQWLTAFPSYAFWFAAPPDGADRCVRTFTSEGLSAAQVGQITKDPLLRLRHGSQQAEVANLSTNKITGLWPH